MCILERRDQPRTNGLRTRGPRVVPEPTENRCTGTRQWKLPRSVGSPSYFHTSLYFFGINMSQEYCIVMFRSSCNSWCIAHSLVVVIQQHISQVIEHVHDLVAFGASQR
jgi:hypothetical protein